MWIYQKNPGESHGNKIQEVQLGFMRLRKSTGSYCLVALTVPHNHLFSGSWCQSSLCKDQDRGRQLPLLTHGPFTTFVDMGLWLVFTKEPSPHDLLVCDHHQIIAFLTPLGWKFWEGISFDTLFSRVMLLRPETHPAPVMWGQRVSGHVNETWLFKPVIPPKMYGLDSSREESWAQFLMYLY